MKIFGIGLSKTGTTSLASALEILGYRIRDYPGIERYEPGNLASIDAHVLDEHDALTDTPIPSFYRELDQRYPGAKFILTVRDMDGWLLSCKKQFTAKQAEKQNDAHNRLFMDLYGTTVFDEALFRNGYQRFVSSVLDHFRGRTNDLLVLDVAAGQGWKEICGFLTKPLPGVPFPKTNVTRVQWMDLQDLVSIAREAGQAVLRAHEGVRPAKETQGIGLLARRAAYALAGGRSFALSAAVATAQKVLARRLERMNGTIPVVSRLAQALPVSERNHWSHFWLIDPLDGEAGFGASGGEFTINIALIENRKPIAGVVHAPLSRTTYFAMAGKGAFKSTGDGAALPLQTLEPGKPGMADVAPCAPSSMALALCRLIGRRGGATEPIAGSMEWHSAAPDAMARLTGRRLLAGEHELGYNKPDWSNPAIVVA